MVSPWDLIAGLLAVVLGGVLVVFARRGARSAQLVWSRPTRAIAALTPGPSEIAGTVHATRARGYSLNGLAAVAVHTRVEALVSNGKSSSWVEAGRCTDVLAEVEVRDGTGACALALDESTVVVGPMFRATCHAHELTSVAPAIAQRTLKNPSRNDHAGYQLRVTQTVIADGGQVLVEGEATEAGLVDGQGYRDARTRFALRGTEGAALLLSGLSHRATLWRAAWPALTVGGAGVLLALLGACWIAASAYLAARAS